MFNKAEPSNASNEFPGEVLVILQYNAYIYAIVIVSLLAVVTNILVVLTIFVVRNIRRAASSIFFVNLCVVEILASLTVLATSLVVICGLHLEVMFKWQALLGGIQEFSKTVSILTIVQISFEKYIYIVHPMRHEACMTTGRSLASLCVTWLLGLLVCMLPELFDGKYSMPTSVVPIKVLWKTEITTMFIPVMYFVLMFVLPIVLITVISLKLFKVAKRAMIAVEPAPNPLLPSYPSAKSSRKYSTVFVVEISDTQEKPRLSSSQCVRPLSGKSVGNEPCDQDPNKNNLHMGKEKQLQTNSLSFNNGGLTRSVRRVGSQEQKKISRRALLFLTLPVCYFIMIWLPISIQHMITSHKDKGTSVLEITSFIILQISYVINPIFYSFMSKSFRQEAFSAIKTCCTREDDSVRPFSVGSSNEDFMQFLHRTSDFAQGEKDKQRKLSCNECGEIVVLNSFPENCET